MSLGSLPAEFARPIAIVGAGWIVRTAHLPAYRKFGIPVRGIFDIDMQRAQAVAQEFGLQRVYASLDELIADEAVEVVDIAVSPKAQVSIAPQLIDAGRHLLCQKPLALDYEDAARIVEAAAGRGLCLGVNQQLRHAGAISAVKGLLSEGQLRDPYLLNVSVNIEDNEWANWPWLPASRQLDLRYFSIHLLDMTRYLLGDPQRVFASASRFTDRGTAGETRTISTLVYEGGLRACINVCHDRFAPGGEASVELFCRNGAARVDLGWLAKGVGQPDSCRIFIAGASEANDWQDVPLSDHWSNDAFAGPMMSLLQAISTGSSPNPSGRDNLSTLRLIDALYRSIDNGELVTLG